MPQVYEWRRTRDRPLVSICVPAFNRAEHLSQALDSALEQDYEPVEIVVVDDASTDNTYEVARRYEQHGVRVQRNRVRLGQSRNRNVAWREGAGDLIKFLDSDDVLEADCVSTLAECYFREPRLGLAFGRRRFIATGPPSGALGKWIAEFGNLHESFHALAGVNDGRELLREWLVAGLHDNWIGEPSAVMVSRSHLESAGGFNRFIRQTVDTELWVRLLAHSYVGFVDRVVAGYRIGEESEHSINARERGDWLDRLWTFESLLRDPEVRRSYPEICELHAAERRQAWRTVARAGLVRNGARMPIGPFARYVSHQLGAGLGMAPTPFT